MWYELVETAVARNSDTNFGITYFLSELSFRQKRFESRDSWEEEWGKRQTKGETYRQREGEADRDAERGKQTDRERETDRGTEI